MEYYIYNIPVFAYDRVDGVSIPEFCQQAEDTIHQNMLVNVDIVYIGNMHMLKGRNAAYHDGAIYMTSDEPTVEDMLENFVHEVAHSLESTFGHEIYTEDLVSEYRAKREDCIRYCRLMVIPPPASMRRLQSIHLPGINTWQMK